MARSIKLKCSLCNRATSSKDGGRMWQDEDWIDEEDCAVILCRYCRITATFASVVYGADYHHPPKMLDLLKASDARIQVKS